MNGGILVLNGVINNRLPITYRVLKHNNGDEVFTYLHLGSIEFSEKTVWGKSTDLVHQALRYGAGKDVGCLSYCKGS